MDNFLSNFLSYLAPDEGDVFFLFWAKQALISVAILVVFYLLSKLLRLVLARLGVRYTAVSGHDLVERMLQRISEPAALLTNCAGLYLMIRRLPLPERLPAIAAGVVFIVNVGIVTNIINRVLDELLTRYSGRLSPDMSRQLIPLVQKLCAIFLFGTALVITLKHFNYDILSLVTALGVGSLAIGLAAKDTLANMISGFTLMIDRPFRIGDRISLGGQIGDVIDVGLRSTKIKSGDNTFMVVPNSELCNSTVVNMAFPDSRVTGRINVQVSYGTDVENAKLVLTGAAAAVPGVLTDPAPQAYFTNFGENGLNLALIFWVPDYTQLFSIT
ncbi:mechanosensitive ion channel family protein, partial [Geomonas sp.]|uniref:mechanosensitive ion channel family protein n=1 Tax=Geomonas sp. TaxID=2651584 RepID=UPI002B4A80DD